MAGKIDRMWIRKEMDMFSRGFGDAAKSIEELAERMLRHLAVDKSHPKYEIALHNLTEHLRVTYDEDGVGFKFETDAAEIQSMVVQSLKSAAQESSPKALVDRLLEDADPNDQKEAERIYDLALTEHPDWWPEEGHVDWEGERPDNVDRESDVSDVADGILDKIISHYNVEPGSTLADLIYEHVYAGLT